MRIGIVDTAANIDRYMDILKQNYGDGRQDDGGMNLQAMRYGNVFFYKCEEGMDRMRGMHAFILMVNMKAVRKQMGVPEFGKFTYEIARQGRLVMDMKEDDIVKGMYQ